MSKITAPQPNLSLQQQGQMCLSKLLMQPCFSKLLSMSAQDSGRHFAGSHVRWSHLELLLFLLAHLLPLVDDSPPENPRVLLQVGEVGGGGGAGHQGGATVPPGAVHGAQRLAVRLQQPVVK